MKCLDWICDETIFWCYEVDDIMMNENWTWSGVELEFLDIYEKSLTAFLEKIIYWSSFLLNDRVIFHRVGLKECWIIFYSFRLNCFVQFECKQKERDWMKQKKKIIKYFCHKSRVIQPLNSETKKDSIIISLRNSIYGIT